MPAVTIRNLSDATHRALKVRAAQHCRSAEAEIRDILETAVRPDTRLRLGSALAARSGACGAALALAEACERDDTAQLDTLAAAAGIDREQLARIHLHALAWAHKLTASEQPPSG